MYQYYTDRRLISKSIVECRRVVCEFVRSPTTEPIGPATKPNPCHYRRHHLIDDERYGWHHLPRLAATVSLHRTRASEVWTKNILRTSWGLGTPINRNWTSVSAGPRRRFVIYPQQRSLVDGTLVLNGTVQWFREQLKFVPDEIPTETVRVVY
jgi:hypothetical protein